MIATRVNNFSNNNNNSLSNNNINSSSNNINSSNNNNNNRTRRTFLTSSRPSTIKVEVTRSSAVKEVSIPVDLHDENDDSAQEEEQQGKHKVAEAMSRLVARLFGQC